MINLTSLINLLPDWFKFNDTYKDNTGKGILERFLEICGTYFQNDIVVGIDNILDIIDVDTTHEMYLNYIWEFFGKIPYAYGAIYKGNLGDIYYNEKTNREVWEKNLDEVPRARYRDILKYAISLYKIRGTLNFYNILLGFYDMSATISDPSGDFTNPGGSSSGPTRGTPSYDNGLNYDTVETTYDQMIDCLSCSEVNLVVTLPRSGVTQDETDRILLLLNRFRPLNVIPFSYENVTFT